MNGYKLIRPLLFRLDPETAHHLTVRLLALAGALPPARWLLRRMYSAVAADHPVHLLGMDFPNPIGLAAGFDKDGRALPGLACLGFGFLEAGTVTPLPQAGNPKPRVFRLPPDRAVINHMGFPNAGAEKLLRRVCWLRTRPDLLGAVRLGINIGKNTATPIEQAAGDYIQLLEMFAPYADYIAVNVSCPNLSGLSRLQGRDELEALLGQLLKARVGLEGKARRVPMLVKLSPDLTDGELEDAVGVCLDQRVEGIIATNTTTGRDGLVAARCDHSGGLSGKPLEQRATGVVRRVAQLAGGRLAVIGVGGVFDAAGAQAKLDAGADLVQVYTGMIYQGPGVAERMVRGLGVKLH
jgi:dihydroorotate dehydrogenase